MVKVRSFIAYFLLYFLLSSFLVAEVSKSETELKSRLISHEKWHEVIGLVEEKYVDEITLEDIINKALQGLLQELDAHSTFMDEKAFNEIKIQTTGEFGGLGITVGIKDGALTVISPIDGTPAFKAGVKSGDIILKIDDKSTLNMSLSEAVSYMRGKPKTAITLTLVRQGETKPIVIEVIRDIIKIESVKVKMIGEDILYIRISSFDQNVAWRIRELVGLSKEYKGIVLDLRNNPGGLLTQAVAVADFFIDRGVIVSQRGRNNVQEEKFYAKQQTTLTNKPLIVLVNGGSASASEIVSGALQDHKRAIVVGEKTFGKGSVQVVLPLKKSRDAIKLTISKYYLPKGRTIQAKGITPDIISYPGKARDKPLSEFSIKEADLKKHLENELDKVEDPIKQEKDKQSNSNSINEKDLFQDNQLNTAVNILKSLIIMKE